jgi:hypothetical protein
VNALHKKQYDEVCERLEALSRALRLHWPAPAEARDEEMAVTAYRRWDGDRLTLVLSVASSLRLLPVLRRYGYRWTLRRVDTGEEIAGECVLGRLSAKVPDLPDGEYILAVHLLEAPPSELLPPSQPEPDVWRLPLPRLLGKTAADPGSARALPYEVVADFRSPPESAPEDGTRAVQLRRWPNRILTLWVELTGPAADGGLARFTIRAPDVESPRAVGFVGLDERGVGEVNLSRFDYRLQWSLAPNDTIVLQPLRPEDLVLTDRPGLERSCAAAVTGGAALEAALTALTALAED